MNKGTLYLIPTPLGEAEPLSAMPPATLATLRTLEHFVVEEERSARRFLGTAAHPRPIRELQFAELNEHTKADAIPALLQPLLDGKDVGLLSEAGCPAVADPGAQLVALAHARGITVKPLVGPSSLLLALMASGLEGQRFCFHGYLPVEKAARQQRLRELEKQSRQQNATQLFIETPYRNAHLLDDLLAVCAPATRLCIAQNLTQPNEQIITRPVNAWKKLPLPDLHKQPAVFLMLA